MPSIEREVDTEVEWWLLGEGDWGISVSENENVLGVEGGDGCTSERKYLMPELNT